ncbi:oxidoreductase [Stachybotrys elegans]|uniref:Oxidoreductase n=1 Tax=Stachybotrys elegans TaxID=80388 RepID=A0A8K0WXN8_9HYPO|nr:oxidoreductase [Stachybotrys elegans]
MAESFDFIIAGGGTAGLVLAARLSEDPSQKILVLEAGADISADPRLITPALNTALMGTDADWAFTTVPQDLLDNWAKLGNPGWGSADMDKYLRKPFTFPKVDDAAGKALGVTSWTDCEGDGPLQLSFPGDASHPLREAWADTFKDNGYTMPGNPYAEASQGSFSCLATIDPKTRTRVYSANAYYQPAKDRENLRVLTGALVEKVLLETADGATKAKGIQYTLNGETLTATATKEVILSAGTIQSPKLLELSGIGNPAILEKHGIEVVQDLVGVGENFQDHLVCGISFEVREGIETLDGLMRQEPEALGKAMQEYATSQSGPLTSIGILSYAYLPIIEHISGQSLEAFNRALEARSHPSGSTAEQSRDAALREIGEKMLLDPKGASGSFFAVTAQTPLPTDPDSDSPTGPVAGNWITFASMLTQPLSRGSVHIQSNKTSDAPTIDPRYLSEPIDVEVFARHMLYVQQLAGTGSLAGLFKQPPIHRDPASRLGSVEEAKNFVRQCAISMWHYGGTCSMLPRDKAGVVDPQLRVHGVENLRVVDSSVVPIVSTGNMQHCVYAIAEKAADMIKETYGLK